MIELLSLSALTIPGLSTFIWFLFNVYGNYSLNSGTFCVSLLIGSTITYFIYWFKQKIRLEKPNITKLGVLLVISIMSIITINLVFNYYWPPSTEFDALTMYDYRGKIFYLEHTITKINNSYHGSYPLYTSLAHTAMYLLGFQNPKPFYSLIFLAFTGLFFSWTYKHTKDTKLSLLACLLLITTPAVFHHSIIAYTNFVYLAYMGGSLLYLADYLEGDQKSLIPLVVLTGITAWIRPANHPFVMMSLILLVFSAIKKHRKRDIIIFISGYLLFLIPWNYFQTKILHITSIETSNLLLSASLITELKSSIIPILTALFRNFTDIKYAGLSGLFMIFTLVSTFLRTRRITTHPIVMITVLQLLVWCVLCFLIRSEYTTYDAWVGILYDSMQRLFIFFFPLIIGSGIILLK